MSLFYLVEQKHAVWRLANGVGEQSAVLIAHISCRRTDELGNCVLFGIFAHVETHQLHAQFLCQHARHLGLAHSSGTHKEQRRQRLVVVDKPRLGELHSLNNILHSLVLTVDNTLDALLESLKLSIVVFLHGSGIDLHHFHQHIVDKSLIHRLLFLATWVDVAIGTSLVDEVDGLVGQEAPHDVLGASPHSIFNRRRSIGHMMVGLITLLQAIDYLDGLIYRWLKDVDLLEAAHNALAARELAIKLLVGGRTYKAQLAAL